MKYFLETGVVRILVNFLEAAAAAAAILGSLLSEQLICQFFSISSSSSADDFNLVTLRVLDVVTL